MNLGSHGTSLLVALLLACVHLGAGRLRFLDVTPRSIWLSIAGGISVAYVFLHLLPELAAGQDALEEQASGGWLGSVGQEVYLLALCGLTVFYGLERVALRSRGEQRRGSGGDVTHGWVFAVHMGAFALYNALIGYLLLHGEQDNLWLYAGAMGLHFLVNDHGLREHHKHQYHQVGRWVLAAAVLGGWAIGALLPVPHLAVRLLIALLAGGVILNVLKEELPEQRESRFSAFLAGAVVYGAMLVLAA